MKEHQSTFRVLIIEDETTQAQTLSQIIDMAGYQSTVAHTLASSIDQLQQAERIDCLVCDIVLGEESAFSMFRQCLYLGLPIGDIPIIFLTANPAKDVLDTVPSQLTVVGLMRKPYAFEDLIRVLKKVNDRHYSDCVDAVQEFKEAENAEEAGAIAQSSDCIVI